MHAKYEAKQQQLNCRIKVSVHYSNSEECVAFGVCFVFTPLILQVWAAAAEERSHAHQ